MNRGTVDHAPVYPRERVMRRALELSASAVILVHNHPSGDPTPSQADIADDASRSSTVAGPLGISVHDHIIVGKDGHVEHEGAEADLGCGALDLTWVMATPEMASSPPTINVGVTRSPRNSTLEIRANTGSSKPNGATRPMEQRAISQNQRPNPTIPPMKTV